MLNTSFGGSDVDGDTGDSWETCGCGESSNCRESVDCGELGDCGQPGGGETGGVGEVGDGGEPGSRSTLKSKLPRLIYSWRGSTVKTGILHLRYVQSMDYCSLYLCMVYPVNYL